MKWKKYQSAEIIRQDETGKGFKVISARKCSFSELDKGVDMGVVNKEPFSPGTWEKREECGKVYLLFLCFF